MLTGSLSWRKALTFHTRGYCCWWKIIPSGNLSFVKRILVGGSLGVEPRSVGIALADGLCDLGGEITLAEGLHDWGRRAVSLLNYTLEFALQLRKSTEKLSQGSRVVGDYSLRRLGRLLGTASAGLLNISPPWFPVGDFSQPLVGASVFQVAELRGSPHKLAWSRNSQSVLWCGRRRMEAPNPRKFACY
jgi:hypothetical protein